MVLFSDMEREVMDTPEDSKKAGIVYRDDRYFATLGDDDGVPVEGSLAQNIGIALQAQERLDGLKKIKGNKDDFRRIISLLNCRQTISAVRDITLLRSQVENGERLKNSSLTGAEKTKILEQLSGVPELEADVDRILSLGKRPVFGLSEKNLRRYLDSHPSDLPAVAHVFLVYPQEAEIIQQLQLSIGYRAGFDDYRPALGRTHSFLVLGKDSAGRYVCFEKRGPKIDDRFEIVELSSALPLSMRKIAEYIAFVGPIGK